MTTSKKFKIRTIVMICFIWTYCPKIKAQDIMTLKNGDALIVKVIEITDTEIKYKNTDNLEGPLRVIYKTDVFSIKYQNGLKTTFENETKKTETIKPANVTTVTSAKQYDTDSSDFANIKRKKFGGPRIGITYISPGTSADWLHKKGKNEIITQFGWQFEQRLFTTEDGTSGLFEFVPLIGGFEQGLFIPSASFLIGIRGGGNKNYEFGIGPNLSVIPRYDGNGTTGSAGVVIALGSSLKKGNIYFPINLAFVPSIGSRHDLYDNTGTLIQANKKYETGFKLSLLVGFNTRNK